MFIQGDESQIATADLFLFCIALLFSAKNSFRTLGNHRDHVCIIKVGASQEGAAPAARVLL